MSDSKVLYGGRDLDTAAFMGYNKILEDLFSPGWLERHPEHPACCQKILCEKIIREEKMNNVWLPWVGQIILNAHAQALVLDDTGHNTGLGPLALYGDLQAQRALRQDVKNPDSFEDVMVELYVSAWHLSKGRQVKKIKNNQLARSQEKGERIPDFEVLFPNGPSLVIECKHLRYGSKPTRIKKLIKNANKQVKSFAKANNQAYPYGAVIIDVTDYVGVWRVTDDSIPLYILDLEDFAQSALRGMQNRSVAAAILVWQDYLEYGKAPAVMCGFWRRSTKISHQCAYVPIPRTLPVFEGFSLTYWLSNRRPIGST
ncbi:MAG: hypothetical protein ACXV76_13960 [Halobacteriota archaeon]